MTNPIPYIKRFNVSHNKIQVIQCSFNQETKQYVIAVIDHYGRERSRYYTDEHNDAMFLCSVLQDFYTN